MKQISTRAVRCAIYTRKSSEEGLEQDFNSLDAQREACAAYILSQASEGWVQIPDLYDDGGLSGGTLERPALQRLLADVAAGRIDIIVVYKVDRLTRSLLDFSRLVEAFDKAETSFVSVTQSFNTTTSMGRLTLNMLLSFAQFEREVTAERIRDKIAASKARGMWMGGVCPLGYAPNGRTLDVIEHDAEIVREIYRRYLQIGNVRLLAISLERDRIALPVRAMTSGREHGGKPFTRSQLYRILRSRIYVGEIEHKDLHYPGMHKGVVERTLWDAVQARLALNLQGSRDRTGAGEPSLLAGRITDSSGQPLIATHACKGNKRYRYYVSKDLQHGAGKSGMRIPAREIESAVQERLAAMFDDGLDLATIAGLEIQVTHLVALDAVARTIAAEIRSGKTRLVTEFINAVRVLDRSVEIDCDTHGIATALEARRMADASPALTLSLDVRLTRSGHVMRLVQSNGAAVRSEPVSTLIKPILQGRRWWAEIRNNGQDVTSIARREGYCTSYVSRIVRLAFLSPPVVDAILAGRQRDGVDRALITAAGGFAASWKEQAKIMLADA